jgi:hypothetical protein
MYKKLLILLALTVLIAGCGQQVPQVNTTMAAPGNLVVKGIVYAKYYVKYATGAGSDYYVTRNGGPVVGATVTLTGTYETKTTTSNGNGEYVFENVRYGSYYVKATKDNYQAVPTSLTTSSVDGSVTTQDLQLSAAPVIRTLSPAANGTIETSAQFVVTFNEPMDTATVRPRIVAAGIRTFAAGDTVNVSCAWSDGDKVLTITPLNTLSPNLIYSLYLANTFDEVKDKEGNILAVRSSSSYGAKVEDKDNAVAEDLNEYFTFKTTAGGAPAAPSGLTIGTDGGQFTATGVDYAALFGGTADIAFNWLPSSSGNVTGYKVYIARSSTGPWCLLSAPTTNLLTGVDVPTTIRNALFDASAGSAIDPVSTRDFPFINEKIYAKVVAYNGEGESSASTANAIELNPPGRDNTVYSGTSTFPLTELVNGYYLAALSAADNKTAYIAFNEPVAASTIATSNFSISGTNDLTEAVLLTSSSLNLDPGGVWAGDAYSIVRITSATNLSGRTLTIGTGVTDLAGNAIPASTTVVIP